MDRSLTRLMPIRLLGVLDFFYRLRGMMKLRGWKVRDSLVLLATLIIHLVLSPARLVLLLYSPPNSKRRGWERRLDSLGYSTFLDCVVVSNDGLFKLRHGIDNIGLVCNNHEPEARSLFQPREGELVVDVGAYIGFYTIRASKLVGSQGKVIAIEAEPSNFDALLFNLRLKC